MAVTPFKKTPPPPDDDANDPLLKTMRRKIARAEQDRNRHKPRISDCYRYALPWRHDFDRTQPNDVLDEIFDETIATVLEDFAADMLNTFTPQKNNWLSEEPAMTFDAGDMAQIREPLARRQTVIFSEMSRSNLYQAMQECYLDLGPGTMCVLIQDIDAAKPIHCEAIPATELLITRGPYGFVDGQFRRKEYLREDAKTLWPDGAWEKLGAEPADKERDCITVTDGCWRDWSDRGNERYHYVVECNGKKIWHKEYIGAGSCPFVVARWSKDSTTAWGVGPTYRTLPAIKTVNHFNYLSLKNYDKHVDPVTSYEDDGVMNLDNGIEPGKWLPRAVGSEPPKAIESQARLDLQAFEIDEKRSIIRRAHYQDEPEQIGKTPPTATQWADEAAKKARRMGTPATNLVQEWQIPIYRRFAYLLERRGVLPRVELNGEQVALQPVSPLIRAQEQEEVIRNDRFAELIVARFGPQVGIVIIDIVKYAQKQAKLLGVDPDLIRDETQIASAIEQLLPVLRATGSLPGSTPDVAVPPGLAAGAAA